MGSRVTPFELIRRDREAEGASIRELSRRHGVHRRAVRQALAAAQPPQRARPAHRPAPALGPYHALIDQWLVADREAPRKQRHTARRVFERLTAEHGAQVAETTVRDFVRARRRQIGMPGEAYVPQIHHPGAEAEVDWGEATVIMRQVPIEIGLFYLRACHSGATWVGAFPRMTQQAFLEGHAEAFDHFGCVFSLIRYDNLKSAVKPVLRGRRRVEADRLVAMRSHYRSRSAFTLVGIEGAHERGGVEGEVGRYRRRHLVPVPSVESWAELDALIAHGVRHDLGRRIAGHTETVGQALLRERVLLSPLPAEHHQTDEISSPRVDAKALVSVRASRYSVPVGLAGLRVQARIGASEVIVTHRGRVVARHERSYERLAVVASLDHYLDLLRHLEGYLKPSQVEKAPLGLERSQEVDVAGRCRCTASHRTDDAQVAGTEAGCDRDDLPAPLPAPLEARRRAGGRRGIWVGAFAQDRGQGGERGELVLGRGHGRHGSRFVAAPASRWPPQARRLAPWAVEFRYGNPLGEEPDRRWDPETVAEVRGWLDSVIGEADEGGWGRTDEAQPAASAVSSTPRIVIDVHETRVPQLRGHVSRVAAVTAAAAQQEAVL